MKVNKIMKQHNPIEELCYGEYFVRPEDDFIYIALADSWRDNEGDKLYKCLRLREEEAIMTEFIEGTETIPMKIDEITVSEYDYRLDY